MIDDYSWAIAGFYLGFHAPSSICPTLTCFAPGHPAQRAPTLADLRRARHPLYGQWCGRYLQAPATVTPSFPFWNRGDMFQRTCLNIHERTLVGPAMFRSVKLKLALIEP
jgi:hypothetical protein